MRSGEQMRPDLLGRIADARAAMIQRGHPVKNLVLVLGPRMREQLEADAAPFPLFDPEDPNILLDMVVIESDQGEGFWVVAVE